MGSAGALAGEVSGASGALGLGTAVNGMVGGSCGDGLCQVSGGTAAGSNLFHRFSAFDTRGGISGVNVNTGGIPNVFMAVINPAGSFIDKLVNFSGPTNLVWLSPGGISVSGAGGFANVPQLNLSTATGWRVGSGVFEAAGTTAGQAALLSGAPVQGLAGAVNDPAALAALGLQKNGDLSVSGGLLTVEKELLLDAQGGNVLLQGVAVQARGGVAAIHGESVLQSAPVSGASVAITANGTVENRAPIQANGTDHTPGAIRVQAGAVVHQSPAAVLEAKGSPGMASGGTVSVVAGERLLSSATIRATAADPAGKGGTIELTAPTVELEAAQLDASAAGGGGVVRVGGGYQGTGLSLGGANANSVKLASSTALRADATGNGDGGEVVVWSEGATSMDAAVSARGGAEGGDGGLVEISSRGRLLWNGTVDARAPSGARGTLLLDPYNITISSEAQTAGSTPPFPPMGSDSVINAKTLIDALATVDVVVSTGLASSSGSQAGTINLTVPLSWSAVSKLTLQAFGDIDLNGSITAPAGGLTLHAGGDITAGQDISVAKFELASGNWVQNTSALPSFQAEDFRLTGGSFLRAAGGTGVADDPYRLTDIYGVQGMGSSATQLSPAYRLSNDIAAEGTKFWNDGDGFAPVKRFGGSLDGGGHVINGLKINRPDTDYVGLIGYGQPGSEVSNLELADFSVAGRNWVAGLVGYTEGKINQVFVTGTVSGGGYSGGIVGWIEAGEIRTSNSAGFVSGVNTTGGLAGILNNSLVTESHSTAAVSGTSEIGGLVGLSFKSDITQSYASGSVNGNRNIGGLVGYQTSGAIAESYALGDVSGNSRVGGLVGFSFSDINQSYASGKVSGTSDIGGLVGLKQCDTTCGTINQSYWDTQTTGQAISSGGGSPLSTAQARNQANYLGWDFSSIWYQAADMRPILRSEAAVPAGGITTVRNLNQLQLMAANLAGTYKLTADIDASPSSTAAGRAGVWGSGGFVPVGSESQPFTGNLDGAGHVISGLTINRQMMNDVGLIGNAATGASITGLGLEATHATGFQHVGGLVGLNNGANIEQSYSNGTILGFLDVGGLVGWNFSGDLKQVYATGTVSAPTGGSASSLGGLVGTNSHGSITNAYTASAVAGNGRAGGLVGSNNGTITDAFSLSSVIANQYAGGIAGEHIGGEIRKTYASGSVQGNDSGGLVGLVLGGAKVTQSYWDVDTTSQANTAGDGVGLATKAARNKGSYLDWDFSQVWYQAEDMRPILRSEAATPVAGVTPIRNLHQLQLMAANPTGNYQLTADIDASPTQSKDGSPGIWGSGGFVPIGSESQPFIGNLDGAGHVISGLTIDRPAASYIGLIGMAASIDPLNPSLISNIGLEGGSIAGAGNVGALVGYNQSLIAGAHATSSVTGSDWYVGGLVGNNFIGGSIKNAYATGSVTGLAYVGGLVGENYRGTILQSYASGSVHGSHHVGGIAGANSSGDTTSEGKIIQAYATGVVSGDQVVGGFVGGNNQTATIRESYSIGRVDGLREVGGFAGGNDGVILGSYWDREKSNQQLSDGGVPLTTQQFRDQVSFDGWNFSGDWNLVNAPQPYLTKLQSQLPNTATIQDATSVYSGSIYEGTPKVNYSLSGFVPQNALLYNYDSGGLKDVRPINAGTYDVIAFPSTQQQVVSTIVSGKLVIDPMPISISGTIAVDKTYDGSTDAVINPGYLSGLIGSEKLILSASGSFDSKNAGLRSATATYSLGDDTASGGLASNYSLAPSTGLSATIGKATLSISGTTASDKTYDGSTDAVINLGSLSGLIGSETLNLSASGTFDSKNAGSRTAIATYSLGDDSASGGLASNYSLAPSTGLSATIGKADLTLQAVEDSKFYDGNIGSIRTPIIIGRIFANDSISGLAQSFNTKDVLTANSLAVNSSYKLEDGNGGNNYSVNLLSASGMILPRTQSIWSGLSSELWSDPGNWDALPSAANVNTVLIPAGTTGVRYDSSAGNTQLQSLINNQSLSLDGGSLAITGTTAVGTGATLTLNGGAFSTSSLTNSGLVTGSGALLLEGVYFENVSGRLGTAFSRVAINQSQGDLRLSGVAAYGPISIRSASGDLSLSGTVRSYGTLIDMQAHGSLTVLSGSSLVSPGGAVKLVAGGQLNLDGNDLAPVTIDTRGAGAGGMVQLDGGSISINNARVDTSGISDGGRIHIGGLGSIIPSTVTIFGSSLVADPPSLGGQIDVNGANIAISNSKFDVVGRSGGAINLGSAATGPLSLDNLTSLIGGGNAIFALLGNPVRNLASYTGGSLMVNGQVMNPTVSTSTIEKTTATQETTTSTRLRGLVAIQETISPISLMKSESDAMVITTAAASPNQWIWLGESPLRVDLTSASWMNDDSPTSQDPLKANNPAEMSGFQLNSQPLAPDQVSASFKQREQEAMEQTADKLSLESVANQSPPSVSDIQAILRQVNEAMRRRLAGIRR